MDRCRNSDLSVSLPTRLFNSDFLNGFRDLGTLGKVTRVAVDHSLCSFISVFGRSTKVLRYEGGGTNSLLNVVREGREGLSDDSVQRWLLQQLARS